MYINYNINMFNIKNISKNTLTPRFINQRKFKKLVVDNNYQIVQILEDKEWIQDHILFSVHLTPNNFINEYKDKLDKNKKIVLYGDYHFMAQYYRVLNFNGYKVYLVK